MQHPKYEVWPYKKVLPEHVPVLISRYTSGESARKICLDLPFSEDVALKVLRDFGVPIKTRKENRFSMGFKINEDAFSDPTEAECAYFYGWLLTDGCLRERKYAHCNYSTSTRRYLRPRVVECVSRARRGES